MKRIYLDFAATTPVDADVVADMNQYHQEVFGNAASNHFFGQQAQQVVDDARFFVAHEFGVRSQDVFFTPGATESNNLFIQSIVDSVESPHVILGANEHSSVFESSTYIEESGGSASYAASNEYGEIDIESVREQITDMTVLISIMWVNNEIGSVNDIKKIGDEIKIINKERKETGLPKIYFHSDVTQAIGYYDLNFNEVAVDAVSFSAHKFYGPKGIGCLVLREGVAIDPLFFGGQQEMGKRPGTTNVPAIAGLLAAYKNVSSNRDDNFKKVADLKKYFSVKLSEFSSIKILTNKQGSSPHILSVHFVGVDAEELFLYLDMKGVAVSRSSACSSSSTKASHVLLSMGLSEQESREVLRFSFGKMTTKEDLSVVISILDDFLNH